MGQELILPSLPAAVSRFLTASLDEEKDLSELADLASTDPGLAAQMLRLSNSPFFSKGLSITSLQQATVILGVKLLRNLALTLSVYESFSDLANLPNFSLGGFWYHCLSAAVCAKTLSQKTGYQDPDEAFIAGLLHDIGQLVLIKQDPKGYQQIFQLACSGHTVIEAEEEIWGKGHAEAGAEILKGWRLQPFICDAVRFHHHPLSEVRSSLELTRIVYYADVLSHSITGNCGVDLNYLHQLGKELVGLESERVDEIREEIDQAVNELAQCLGFNIEKESADLLLDISPKEEDFRKELKDRARDYSLLVGTLQNLISARNEQELLETFIHSLVLFLDAKSLVFLKKIGTHLHGEMAVGTRADALCKKLVLKTGIDAIWDHAFEKREPVSSRAYFASKSMSILEKQVISYMGCHFWACPVSAKKNDLLGCILIGERETEEPIDKDILTLLTGQVAQALKTHRLRTLLKKEQAVNEAILSHSTTGYLLCDETGRIFFWNPFAKKLLGIPSQEPYRASRNIWAILGLGSEDLAEIKSRTSKGEVHELSPYRFLTPSGQERWFRISAVPIEIGGSRRILIALNDITHEVLLQRERERYGKKLEKELQKKTEELKGVHEELLRLEKLKATGDFARKVVHEVNNPLGVIKNYLRLLKIQYEKGTLDLEAVETIDKEIDRISKILNQLRDLARGGESPHPNQSGSIEKALKDIERLYKADLEESHIGLNIVVEPDLPLVKLDEDRIKQVIMNLIKNSKEAMDGSSGEINIHVFKRGEDRVVIEVKDTGPGISPEVKKTIFDPYVSTKGASNSGLGLSVCHGIIKGVGGDIRLKDQEKGACFEIDLPVAD